MTGVEVSAAPPPADDIFSAPPPASSAPPPADDTIDVYLIQGGRRSRVVAQILEEPFLAVSKPSLCNERLMKHFIKIDKIDTFLRRSFSVMDSNSCNTPNSKIYSVSCHIANCR